MHLCVFTLFAYILFFQIYPYVKYLLDTQNLIEGDFPHHWIGTRKWNKMREWRNIVLNVRGMNVNLGKKEGGCLRWYGNNEKRSLLPYLYVWCDHVYVVFVYQYQIHSSPHLTNKIPYFLNHRDWEEPQEDLFAKKAYE